MPSSPQFVSSLPAKSQAVLRRLTEELVLREQIIRHLSQELTLQAQATGRDVYQGQAWSVVQQLHERVSAAEQHLREARQQLHAKQAQITDLERLLAEVRTRNQQLAQLLQETPELYRQQLAERLEPVRQRLADLQSENQQLKTELRSISYRLSASSRPVARVELPKFVQQHQGVAWLTTAGLA